MTVRRKLLARLGERGSLVRLFEVHRGGERRYVVQWGPRDAREQRSWPGTKVGRQEAEAFLKAYHATLQAAPVVAKPRLTLRELWDRYREAEFGALRPRTRQLYAEAWRRLELHFGLETVGEDLDVPAIVTFRRALDGLGLATATVHRTITCCRIVFRWAEASELMARNRWHLYRHKIAKELRTKPRAEYRADEFARIWLHYDPTKPQQWRPYVAIGLLGLYGNRQTELLAGLQWPSIVLEGPEARIEIPGQYVKTGEDLVLPMVPLARELLAVAAHWRAEEGYTGPHVLYSGQSPLQRARGNAPTRPHYTIQSLHAAIRRAERATGVPTIKYRAGHGFRRGVVGDVATETGDVALALQAVGDRDIRQAQAYRVRRLDQMRALFARRGEQITERTPQRATDVQPMAETTTAEPLGSAAISNEDN